MFMSQPYLYNIFLSRTITLECRSRSPKSVVNDSKIFNSLLFPIAGTHPPYSTDGKYNIYLKKYEYVS